MYIHMTSGTYDYLENLQKSHPTEQLYLLQDDDIFLLIHETDGATIFNEPRSYEVFESSGHLEDSRFAVMNHIPVTDEGRPLFEYRFKNRAKLIDKQPGFRGIRVLRPLKSDTYIVLTFWKDEISFANWKKSKVFEKAHGKKDKQNKKEEKKIFPRPSYAKTYTILKDEDESFL